MKIYPWERSQLYDAKDFRVDKGDYIVVKTGVGIEIGEVESEERVLEEENEILSNIVRRATNDDFKKIEEMNKKRPGVLKYCKDKIKSHNLPMKLIDCFYSFDGGRIIFTFVAEGRVDFRNLVKDLTRHFQKSIRLQQVGMRDEAKRIGEFGPCGRALCCRKFMKQLGNVTTELARDQQVAHRGSERLSGVCGRLMCCLAFEEELYKELGQNFPEIETEVKTKQGKGKVVSWNVLKQSINVQLKDKTIIEVPLTKKKRS